MVLYEKIFKKLAAKKIKYLVIGGMAVNFHGYYRATGDLDIMISLEEADVRGFVEAMESLGWRPHLPVQLKSFLDRKIRDGWIRDKGMKVFTVYNPKRELEHLDVMVETYIDFKKAYEKREEISLGSVKVPVASIPDLIRLKKIAGRERDRIDIGALREIQKIRNEKKK